MLRLAGLSAHHELFRTLVSQKFVRDDPARDLCGDQHDQILRTLLDKNIIAAHPDLTFTFHSRHVESFFKQEVETQSDSPNGETR